MLTGHPAKIVVLLAATGLLVGCAEPGPFSRDTARRWGRSRPASATSSSRTSSSASEVGKLQSENREIENRLVQEESVNGDLAARLDDARTC